MTEQNPSPPSTLIRQSEILHRSAIDGTTLEEMGRVDVLWMFPQVNRVLGIVVKPRWFGSVRLVFKLPQVKAVKAQILVRGEAEETTVDKVQKLESLIDTEVWINGGDRIGTITDCLFDLNSGVIIRYLMVPSGQFPKLITRFTDGLYLISPKQIQSFSPQRVLIADESVEHLSLYSEGIRLKLATMTAKLKQDYWDGATEEWRSLSHHVQFIAHKAADRVMSLAEKAQALSKNLAQKVSETVTDKVEEVEEAIADEEQPWNDPEWVDTVTDTVKAKGKAVVSQVTERSRPVVNRLKTVQDTIKTSVANHLNTSVSSQTSTTVGPHYPDAHSAQDAVDDGAADLDWDDVSADDSVWKCDNADDVPIAGGAPSDPWDDWDDGDHDGTHDGGFDKHQPSNCAQSNSTAFSSDPMADPWDTKDAQNGYQL
ncbi:MAG: hypothetical protein F6K30_09990 [Cyanothece sp. SIO2G6]|nr:hypothetical protein [Cyanothece sp. SIO2G6]